MTSAKYRFYRQADMRLKKLQARITDLEVQVGRTKADIRVRHDQKMTQIRGQYAQAMQKLGELEKAREASWMELRSEVDEALNVLREAVDTISQDVRAQFE